MDPNLAHLGAGLGASISVIGAGIGIGKLASAALEGAARQPEASGDLRTTMIIAAALIEGVALFSCVIAMLLAIR
ncbi:MAG: ATP synthase F0 subunit C [Candidatus Kapaibacteriales bacterium]